MSTSAVIKPLTSDVVGNVVRAIATQEGWFSPITNKSRNNPGNLRYAGQLGAHRPASSQELMPIAQFDTPEAGMVALYRQVLLQIAQGQTLAQLINQWAPSSDHNDTSTYLKNVAMWTGLPTKTPLISLIKLYPLQF